MKEIPLTKPALAALYQKVGGDEGLRTILRDFYSRMSRDILIGFFFDGKDTKLIADRQQEFLTSVWRRGVTGEAPTSYTGKPPAKAHNELAPIGVGHFDRRLRILENTLRDHGLGDEDIRTWMQFEDTFRAGIIS